MCQLGVCLDELTFHLVKRERRNIIEQFMQCEERAAHCGVEKTNLPSVVVISSFASNCSRMKRENALRSKNATPHINPSSKMLRVASCRPTALVIPKQWIHSFLHQKKSSNRKNLRHKCKIPCTSLFWNVS